MHSATNDFEKRAHQMFKRLACENIISANRGAPQSQTLAPISNLRPRKAALMEKNSYSC